MTAQLVSKKIAFKIPFNLIIDIQSDIHKRSQKCIMNPSWIKNRIAIFMNYTLKSLMNQSNQSFLAYILYHAPSENIIFKELRLYPQLPKNIRFIREEDYSPLIENYIRGSDFYYEIELGSDDLYHRDFVQYLFDYVPKPSTRILICQDGYIFSSIDNVLAEYFNYSSFFNCWIYHSKDYINHVRYSYSGFVGAINLKHELIPWRTYINHSHEENIAFSYAKEKTTPWGRDKAYIGKTITDSNEKQALLSAFMGD